MAQRTHKIFRKRIAAKERRERKGKIFTGYFFIHFLRSLRSFAAILFFVLRFFVAINLLQI